MKYRTFTKLAAAPFAFVEAPGIDAARKSSAGTASAKIKLGHQNWSDDVSFKVLAAPGVNHIGSAEPCQKFVIEGGTEGRQALLLRLDACVACYMWCKLDVGPSAF